MRAEDGIEQGGTGSVEQVSGGGRQLNMTYVPVVLLELGDRAQLPVAAHDDPVRLDLDAQTRSPLRLSLGPHAGARLRASTRHGPNQSSALRCLHDAPTSVQLRAGTVVGPSVLDPIFARDLAGPRVPIATVRVR